MSRNCAFVLLFLILGEYFQGVALAQPAAAAPLLVQDPPPEKEAGLEKNRPPWRLATPTLEDAYLPDLQTLPPFDLYLVADSRTGRRVIRFSNSVWNSGAGRLELRGRFDMRNNTIEVTQVLFGFDEILVKRRVSEFVFHPIHNHWHWEDFSVYEIRAVGPEGQVGEPVVTSGKVGFCMLDTSRIGEEWIRRSSITEIEIRENRRYGSCGWRRQGISIGWVDTYDSDTPGQVMDVSDLPDGLYALRSTVDPQGILFEADRANNTAWIYFYLLGDQLRVIGEDLSGYLPSTYFK